MKIASLKYDSLSGDGLALVIGDTYISKIILDKPSHQLHLVSFNLRDHIFKCSCQSYWYRKNECKHIKLVKEKLLKEGVYRQLLPAKAGSLGWWYQCKS